MSLADSTRLIQLGNELSSKFKQVSHFPNYGSILINFKMGHIVCSSGPLAEPEPTVDQLTGLNLQFQILTCHIQEECSQNCWTSCRAHMPSPVGGSNTCVA